MKHFIIVCLFLLLSNPLFAAPTTLDTSSYDAFSTSMRLDADTIIHVFRRGTSHATDVGALVRQDYDISAGTWGTVSTVYSDGTLDVRDPVIGKIGTKVFIFFSKYNFSKQTTSGYITSSDNGATWSTYTEMYAALGADDGMNFHNGFVKNYTEGKYMIPWARHDNSPLDWILEMWFTLDDGDSWDTVEVSSGTTKLVEPSLAHVGGGNIIGVSRDNDGDYLNYYTSNDDGLTWSAVGTSTVMAGPTTIKPAVIWYDEVYDDVIIAYLDRGAGPANKFKYSLSKDPLWSTRSSENFEATVELDADGYDNDGNGYPAIERVSATEVLFIWSKQSSASDSDILYELVTIGDGDS